MRVRLFVVAVVLALLPRAFAQQAGKPACDRACLQGYVDRYMDAMLAHDPSPKLFAGECKFTENGVRLPLGNEGLWFEDSCRKPIQVGSFVSQFSAA
jgi:hypothetical protein